MIRLKLFPSKLNGEAFPAKVCGGIYQASVWHILLNCTFYLKIINLEHYFILKNQRVVIYVLNLAWNLKIKHENSKLFKLQSCFVERISVFWVASQ